MKKTLALLLAVLMFIGCVPIALASETNYNYKISTDFYAKDTNGDWSEITSVPVGSKVKMRASISTNFISGPATLLFAYDKSVISPDNLFATSSTPLVVNEGFELSNKIQQISGAIGTNAANKQLGLGNITQDQFDKYGFIVVSIRTNGCLVYDGSDWLFEIDMTVLRSGRNKTLECFIIPETVCTINNNQGYVAFPYAESEDAGLAGLASAYLWYESVPELESVQVEVTPSPTERTVTWYVDGVEEKVEYYEIGDAITGSWTPAKQGYVFSGWSPEVPAVMPDENITVCGTLEPATDTPYTVEYYVMNTSGDYELTSKTYTGTTDQTVYTGNHTSDVFDINTEKSVLSGVVAADGSLVLKVYYDRLKFTLTTDVDGVITSTEYYYDEKIEVDTPEKQGYVFAGWNPAIPEKMYGDLTSTAVWEASSDTPYTIETYHMGVDGEYYLSNTEECTGTTDQMVTLKAVNERCFVTDEEKSVLSGVVAADGSLVLKVYMERKKFTFTTDVDGVITSTEYYFDEEIKVDTPEKQGYVFAGWNPAIPATMPPVNTTVSATWIEADDVAYTVETYMMNVSGEYELVSTTAHKGTTDQTITLEAVNERCFVTDEEKSVLSGVVAADGSLVLKVYMERKKFTFTTDVDGVITSTEYYFDEEIKVDTPEKQGYVFAGWNPAIPATMPPVNTTVSATWIEADDVAYTVETYMMNVSGEYELVSTTAHKGTTGETVNESYATLEGFDVNEEKSVLSGVIAADGSLVLKVYVDREKYTFTTVVDGASTSAEYLYGAAVTAPENPQKQGFVFKGWSEQIPATMPARNVTVTAEFRCTATVAIKNNPGSKTIKYGEKLRLTAETSDLPADAKVFWYVDGVKKGDGTTFEVSPSSGSVEVTVKIVDANGNNYAGGEISDSERVSVNAGFFQKIISFFKNLFGMNRTVIQKLFR